VLFVANFTPIVRQNYRIGVPSAGVWVEAANSDDLRYGGSGVRNEPVETEPISTHGYDQSIEVDLPPLGAIFLAPSP
jgi:1,4-alpha-glucan branching enzyme